jgi:hypothetical protein
MYQKYSLFFLNIIAMVRNNDGCNTSPSCARRKSDVEKIVNQKKRILRPSFLSGPVPDLLIRAVTLQENI